MTHAKASDQSKHHHQHHGRHHGKPRRSTKSSHRGSFWPQDIAGRIVLLFATGLLIAQTLTGLLYWSDRQLNTSRTMVETAGNRVIAIATLLDSVAPDQYPTLLQALNDPFLRVEQRMSPPRSPQLSSGAPSEPTPPPLRDKQGRKPQRSFLLPQHQRRLERFHDYLAEAIADPITVNVRRSHHQEHPPPRLRPDKPVPLWPSHRQAIITIEKQTVTGPYWWVLTIPIGFGSRYSGPGLPVWLILTGLGIWLLAAWGTRLITAPLLQFAAAADRLGMDVNAPPLPEEGSRELRQAAQAFNQMQQRLQRLIRDRTLMLAAISHDLRTVLTRLRLRSEFIGDPVQQEKAQADLSQMEVMLNSTLVFAKEDSTPEPRTNLDLASLLQSICDDLTDAGRTVEYRGSERLVLQGQPIALRRAFTNVIENAAIYGEVAMVSVKSSPTMVEVAIADRGPGIPPDKREQVFRPFARLEESRNRATGGTGLGLAVARTVIQRHGGTITLRNYPDKDAINQSGGGLIVTVMLPLTI